jgi:hypothetical protein
MRRKRVLACFIAMMLALPLNEAAKIRFNLTSKMPKTKAVSASAPAIVECQETQQLFTTNPLREYLFVTTEYTFQYDSIRLEISTPPPRA